MKKEQRLFERLGKYGVNFQGYNYTDRIQRMGDDQRRDGSGLFDDLQTNVLGTQPNNQRIKIMPMYGDLDDYANNEDSPQIKLLKKQLAVAEAQLEELRAQTGNTEDSKNKQSQSLQTLKSMQSDMADNYP